MKSIVLRDDFREFEIRPEADYKRYLDLIREDTISVFKGSAGVNVDHCYACGHGVHGHKFSKIDFEYRECEICHTLFLSPRPTIAILREFYAKSEGLKFWNSKIMQDTDARKKHIFDPRVRWVLSTCDINDFTDVSYLDYYTKYQYFVEQIVEKSGFLNFYTYRPDHPLSNLVEEKNYRVAKELTPSTYSVITAFEIFDRFYDPRHVLSELHNSLAESGLLFITTISASGFDIRILEGKSRSIVPPIHLNLFTVEGMLKLLKSKGFEILELSSPGSLDVDLVTTAMQNCPTFKLPPVIDDILTNRNEGIKKDF
jgi:hypothetical protein